SSVSARACAQARARRRMAGELARRMVVMLVLAARHRVLDAVSPATLLCAGSPSQAHVQRALRLDVALDKAGQQLAVAADLEHLRVVGEAAEGEDGVGFLFADQEGTFGFRAAGDDFGLFAVWGGWAA